MDNWLVTVPMIRVQEQKTLKTKISAGMYIYLQAYLCAQDADLDSGRHLVPEPEIVQCLGPSKSDETTTVCLECIK